MTTEEGIIERERERETERERELTKKARQRLTAAVVTSRKDAPVAAVLAKLQGTGS